MTAVELADVDLTDDERRLLLAGLMEYGGPAAGDAPAGIGFLHL